jgi:hypothetical protein
VRAEMSCYWRQRVHDAFAGHGSLTRLGHDLDRVPGLSDEDRAVLWLLAWSDPRCSSDSPRSDGRIALSPGHARRRAPR